MPGRKVHDRNLTQRPLHLHAASGLTRAAWCADH
jgi:hypothetical protein